MTLGGQGLFEHAVGHAEVGSQHLAAEFDAAVRIKVVGASIFGDVLNQIQIRAEQVVERVRELMAGDAPIAVVFLLGLMLRQPIQDDGLFFGRGLVLVGWRHLGVDDVLEHQRAIEVLLVEDQLHVEASLLDAFGVAIEAVVLEHLRDPVIEGGRPSCGTHHHESRQGQCWKIAKHQP